MEVPFMASPSLLPAAVIFDMDGVLIDSNPFHVRKWVDLLHEHGIPFDEDELPKLILGHRNDSAFRRFFGEHLTRAEIRQLSAELEAKFRKAFGPHARLLPGLRRFIEACYADGTLMAVASSAMSANVDFIVDRLELRPYMQAILTGDEVSHAKPDPEIYLKTAAKLGVEPAACVAFEDSFVGIEAAERAGMKCIGVASTFPAEDLRRETHADLVVPGFEAVSLPTLRGLFDGAAVGDQVR
jgi:HAD superfamily hydrolase (TIGR01509 family)